jgi:hypothetical protein
MVEPDRQRFEQIRSWLRQLDHLRAWSHKKVAVIIHAIIACGEATAALRDPDTALTRNGY